VRSAEKDGKAGRYESIHDRRKKELEAAQAPST
jgi:hypothetical protein